MTAKEFQQILVNRFKSEILDTAPPANLPKVATLLYDNDGQVLDETKEFVRLNVLHGPTAVAETADLTEFAGVIIFDVFVPMGTGAGRAAEIADLIHDVFSHLEGDEFRLQGAAPVNLGKVRDSYQYQVSINFTRNGARQNRLVTVSC